MAKKKAKTKDKAPGTKSDLYTGLLAISLGSLIAGCIFLYLDLSQYDSPKPNVPKASQPVAKKTAPPGTSQ